jgi:hypothetical protein
MLARTWTYIFNALVYVGCIGVVVYYFKPNLFISDDPAKPSIIVHCVVIYSLVWVLVLILWYLYSTQEFAQIEGLWSIAPADMGAEKYDNGRMVPAKGKVDLLNEYQVSENMSESFTFGFFVSIDNGTIETVKGDSMSSGARPYQNLIAIPGAYNLSVDPLHEVLRINFISHDAKPYEVLIPTLSVRRWHQILITVEGRTADIYQNGVLLKAVALPNVLKARPGKPQIYMESDIYARVAFIQSWPRRIKEKEVSDNYRLNVDDQNRPPLPNTALFGIPNFNFCLGGYCLEAGKPQATGLTHVDYQYA